MKEYRRRLEMCLQRLRPDITISLLRREINFLCDIKDGSLKIGEIHFGRYKYREANFSCFPKFVNTQLTRLWMAQLEKKIKKLDKFVVLTHEDASYWKGLSNLIVIPNPITICNDKLSDCTQKRAIAVGRYTYQKGIDLLISAWKQVYEKHPDWELHIYGGGNNADYQQLADNLGMTEAVICHEAVNDIDEKYHDSSIFILSSRYEGLPLVLMEAMAVGLPSVAFTCPCGPKDIIKNGEDGILCENGNIQQLSQCICKLIENEDLRKSMGQKAADNIRRYTVDNVMEQWVQLFNDLLLSKERSRSH